MKKRSSKQSPASLLKKLGLSPDNPGVFNGEWLGSGKVLESISPINGKLLAKVRTATPAEYDQTISRAQKAFQTWQKVPAPKRGEIIRQLGTALRAAKEDTGTQDTP